MSVGYKLSDYLLNTFVLSDVHLGMFLHVSYPGGTLRFKADSDVRVRWSSNHCLIIVNITTSLLLGDTPGTYTVTQLRHTRAKPKSKQSDH